MGTTTLTKPESAPRVGDSGHGGGGFGGNGFGGNESWESPSWRGPSRAYRTAMWMALTAIVMLFAAFTSALVVRRGLSSDWVSFSIPSILWVNTGVLLSSSLTLELSRRALTRNLSGSFATWLYATTALGILFLAGQLAAWRELAARGIYLASNPSHSFFYVLTGAHGLHLLGGVMALFYLLVRSRAMASGRIQRTALDVTAIYWHFMDGLWLYILFLLTMRF